MPMSMKRCPPDPSNFESWSLPWRSRLLVRGRWSSASSTNRVRRCWRNASPFSGSPTVQALRVVDLSLNTTGGRALLAPVLMQQSNPEQRVDLRPRDAVALHARALQEDRLQREGHAKRRTRQGAGPGQGPGTCRRDRRPPARSRDPVGGARGLAAAVAKGASFPRTLATATAFPKAKMIDCLMVRRM